MGEKRKRYGENKIILFMNLHFLLVSARKGRERMEGGHLRVAIQSGIFQFFFVHFSLVGRGRNKGEVD
jgi:hypothetical protein